ncbi:MAG: NCS2 family permease [Bacteriovoracales bacterium]|nr:NCS2 family permease [Bacteriovoracales bacterium]
MNMLHRHFALKAKGTTVGVEIRAGLVTFLTMSYILFVNPQILSATGMPQDDVVMATALASCVGTLIMGLWANYPFALAPGMGLNAYFTYGIVQGLGVSWQVALAAVLVEGVIFLILSVSGLRTWLMQAIPSSVQMATMCGIGLFLAIIGFKSMGLVADHPATLVTLGDVQNPKLLLALLGLLVMSALSSARVRGAILIGIALITIISWIGGIHSPPESIFSLPRLPQKTLMAFDFGELLTGKMIVAVLSLLFVDIFDTAGTLIGVGRLAHFVDKKGNLPRSKAAFTADSIGTIAGAFVGTSTLTSYIESATGVEEGGKTGLTAVVVALMFLMALFFIPLIQAVPPMATAPALVFVGAMMMRGTLDIPWKNFEESLPAFLTLAAIPFTYSIAAGMSLGMISFVVLKLLRGKIRDVHPLMYVLALLLVIFYGFGIGS